MALHCFQGLARDATDTADLLGIDPSKVSRNRRGQIHGVSEAKLLQVVATLGL